MRPDNPYAPVERESLDIGFPAGADAACQVPRKRKPLMIAIVKGACALAQIKPFEKAISSLAVKR